MCADHLYPQRVPPARQHLERQRPPAEESVLPVRRVADDVQLLVVPAAQADGVSTITIESADAAAAGEPARLLRALAGAETRSACRSCRSTRNLRPDELSFQLGKARTRLLVATADRQARAKAGLPGGVRLMEADDAIPRLPGGHHRTGRRKRGRMRAAVHVRQHRRAQGLHPVPTATSCRSPPGSWGRAAWRRSRAAAR